MTDENLNPYVWSRNRGHGVIGALLFVLLVIPTLLRERVTVPCWAYLLGLMFGTASVVYCVGLLIEWAMR